MLLSISTGKESALRVFVWRQLRRLGAVYLHQSVCLLPDRPVVRANLRPVLARVRSQGGRVRLLSIRVDTEDHRSLVEEQRRDRDTEYGEVVERAPQLLEEIESETARGRATYAEAKESEADLERFEKWLTAINDRDYFHAPAGVPAQIAVQACRDALATFAAQSRVADEAESDQAPVSLRIVHGHP